MTYEEYRNNSWGDVSGLLSTIEKNKRLKEETLESKKQFTQSAIRNPYSRTSSSYQNIPKRVSRPNIRWISDVDRTRTDTYQNVYGTNSALQWAKIQWTILPKDSRAEAIWKINPLSIDSYRPDKTIAWSTPMVASASENMNPLKATVASARSISDLATLPFTLWANALSKDKLSVKQIYDATIEQAKKDMQSWGRSSIDTVAQNYLKSQWVTPENKKVDLKDIAVLSALWIADMFGDLAIMLPWLKTVRSFAKWRKTWVLTRELKWDSKLLWSKEIQLNKDLKIKISPKDNKVVLKWYVRRWATPWEVIPSKLELW